MDIKFPEKLRELFKPARYKIIYGGRGSGKSWGIANYLIIEALRNKHRIMCTREYQASISKSVHQLLSDQIERHGLQQCFTIHRDKITCTLNGSEFLFAGLKKEPEKIKSTEGITKVWVEEGESMSEMSWQYLIPTIRADNSEIIVSFNPLEDHDPTYKKFVLNDPPDKFIRIEINYDDNPYFPQALMPEVLADRESDLDTYNHIWLGKTLQRTEAQILWSKVKVMEVRPKQEWGAPMYGMDFGFAKDPYRLMRCWVFDGDLYIERETGGVRIDNDDLPIHMNTGDSSAHQYTIRADSSRPETISHLKQNGFPKIIACKKGAGSVKEGIAFLRSFRNIIIDPSCKATIEEARLYKYKTDKATGDVLPDIIDAYNHSWDAIRYALEPVMPKRGQQGGIRVNRPTKNPRLPRD